MTSQPRISGPLYADAIATLSGLFGAPLERQHLEAMQGRPEDGPFALLRRIPLLKGDTDILLQLARNLGTPQEGVTQLNIAFCQLFLGLGGPRSAPPYESAYFGEGRLFQEPAGEMQRLLRQQNMQAVTGFSEAPDHLAIELSLLEESMRLAALTEDDVDIDLVAALRIRLQRWLPLFEKACSSFDRTGFYALAARILARLVDEPITFSSEPIAA